MAIPATIMYFTCYDALRDFLWCNLGPGNYAPFLAGAAARSESCWLRPPAPQVMLCHLCVCVCTLSSGRRDYHQPVGTSQDKDAVPAAVLPRTAGLHPPGRG